jgi:hypothetical protein
MLLSAAVEDCHLEPHLLPCLDSTLALLAAASTDASAAARPPNMPGMPCRLCSQQSFCLPSCIPHFLHALVFSYDICSAATDCLLGSHLEQPAQMPVPLPSLPLCQAGHGGYSVNRTSLPSCISQFLNALFAAVAMLAALSSTVKHCLLKPHLLPWSMGTLVLPAAASTDASAAARPPSMPGRPCRLCSEQNPPTLLHVVDYLFLHAHVRCCYCYACSLTVTVNDSIILTAQV